MVGQKPRPKTELDAWQAEILRLTMFRNPGDLSGRSVRWESIGGTEPEMQSSKPKQGERLESGPFEGGKLLLQVQPDRIDWLYVPDRAKESETEPPESFLASIDRFSKPMNRWLHDYPSAPRIAFGAVLNLPVKDREEGYSRISEFLPFSVDAEASSDFLYQINRFRESKTIQGLRINRLSKWSVGILMMQMVHFSTPDRGVTLFPEGDRHRCRIELDINTQPGFPEVISGDGLPALFAELVHLGKEIVREGDIP